MSERFLVIQALFNDLATNALRDGAVSALVKSGVPQNQVDVVPVPGCWELPVVAAKAARSKKYAGIVAIGCVIRGETPHFDYVAGDCARGLMNVSVETGVPVGFGVLTTDNVEQALVRCGLKGGNKGADAANAVLSTLQSLKKI
jgi:6,7-dimethyl-8-ribityllumazine synthase